MEGKKEKSVPATNYGASALLKANNVRIRGLLPFLYCCLLKVLQPQINPDISIFACMPTMWLIYTRYYTIRVGVITKTIKAFTYSGGAYDVSNQDPR